MKTLDELGLILYHYRERKKPLLWYAINYFVSSLYHIAKIMYVLGLVSQLFYKSIVVTIEKTKTIW